MATASVKDNDKNVSSQNKHDKGNASIELIKEKLKEKRRKKALNDSNTSWSRSFSKRKGTNASFVLKASLRSNNQSLARALAASKHEAQQAQQNILELQSERQCLLQQANSKRIAEKECIQRFGNIKQVLSKVTHSLLDAVSSLGQAIDLCSTIPLRESSLGVLPRASLTSDDDSFRIVQKTDQGPATYCRQAQFSSAIKNAASQVMEAADTMTTATINQSEMSSILQSRNVGEQGSSTSEELEGTIQSGSTCDDIRQSTSSLIRVPLSDELIDLADQDLDLELPSLDDLDIPLKFTDENPYSKVKRSRKSTFLDPIAIQKVLADDADYTADQPATNAVKERYVFVHTPPGNVSNYKTIDMELTGVTNDSTSTQDEHNKSLANKSRFNHDEQVIRPWGNITLDKPKNSPTSKGNKPKNKTKPPTNTSKSLLPKPQKKNRKDSSNVFKRKVIKKAASKKPNKKTCLKMDSLRNDLTVFDLSAGDSFSLAPPIFNPVQSKTSHALAGQTKTISDPETAAHLDNEKSTEVPIMNQCPEPRPQEEQLQAITDPQTDIYFANETFTESNLCLEPTAQEEHLQQEQSLDLFNLEQPSQAKPLKPMESVPSDGGIKIKRKSKKAKSIVSPGMDKMAGAVRKTKPCGTFIGSDSKANDIFEGTCLAKSSNSHPTPSWQPAEDISDAASVVTSKKSTRCRQTKDKKVKVKASDPPKKDIVIEDTTKKIESSTTFNLSSPARMTNKDCDDIFKEDINALVHKKKSVSSITTPVAISAVDTERRSGPPALVPSSQCKRGRKRMVDALKEEEPTEDMGEEETEQQETGRRSRRARPVSYKEPSLREKMRRDELKAATKKVKRSKRTALEKVTNVT